MKYWTGYITAAILGAISWALMQMAKKFSTLVDMIYPYVTRTLQDILTEWSGSVDYVLWQTVVMAALVILIGTIVLILAVMVYTVYNYSTGRTDFTFFVVAMALLAYPLVGMVNQLIRAIRDGE